MEPARSPQQMFTVVEGGSPGSLLKAARERMGLSIDDVCEKTKMLPAQVQSMEDGSLEGLPPGGYARAFIKGYARLLGLDADQIVASMVAMNAERPDLQGPGPIRVSPTVAAQREADAQADESDGKARRDAVSVNHNFGQLLSEPRSDSNLVRYSLIALVLGLLVYVLAPSIRSAREDVVVNPAPIEPVQAPPPVMAERIPAGEPGATLANSDSVFPPGTVMVPAQPAQAPAGGAVAVVTPGAAPSAGNLTPPIAAVQPSPSPSQTSAQTLTQTPAQQSAVQPAATATSPAQPVAAQPAPVVAPKPAPVQSAPVVANKPAPASAPVTPAAPTAPTASAAATSPQRIRMSFSDRAYITIRDRDGHVLMAQLNAANTEQTVEGNPPFRVIIGNAKAVRMEYRGRAYDLTPHTREDVARFVME